MREELDPSLTVDAIILDKMHHESLVYLLALDAS